GSPREPSTRPGKRINSGRPTEPPASSHDPVDWRPGSSVFAPPTPTTPMTSSSSSSSPATRLPRVLNGSSGGSWGARLVRELAIQDYVVVGYCLCLWFAALQGVPGHERDLSVQETTTLLTFVVTALIAIRGQ